jgi:hypothetical protein
LSFLCDGCVFSRLLSFLLYIYFSLNFLSIIVHSTGIQHATEVIQLPTSLAVAHLTGDRLIVDSILTTAVRTAAVPGQHGLHNDGTGTGNESVYSFEFGSDESDYEDGTFGGGGGTNSSSLSRKKARGGGKGGVQKAKKKAGARGGGVRKPRAPTGATKKRVTKPKGGAAEDKK